MLRTLEKEPQRRYQHASDIKSDLESIASAAERKSTASGDKVESKRRANRPRLEDQELAGRVLLLRREMLGRVQRSLRPLFWGQMIQMLIGISFIAIGVWCWARNQEVTHRLVSGIILHAYGVLMIIAAGFICAKIGSLDHGKSTDGIREQLSVIRAHYLRSGGLIGFSWWLMWIPLAVGFDAVVYPASLAISLAIGVIGLFVSLVLYARVLRADSPPAEKWAKSFTGESLSRAYLALDDLARMEEA